MGKVEQAIRGAGSLLDFVIKGSDYFAPPRAGTSRAKDPALYSPFSMVKHKNAPYNYVVKGQQLSDQLIPPSVIDPASLLGKTMSFATGDRTSNQRMIDEVNEYLLRNRPLTFGGPEYMDQIMRGAWASEKNPMKAKANALKGVSDLDNILAYMPMSERSGDFSRHMAEVYGDMLSSSGNLNNFRANAKKIDEVLRDRFPSVKNMPSIADPTFPDWLANQKGGRRAQFIKFFDSNQMRELGVPDVAAARFAVTNPDLMLSDTASVGYRFATPKKGADIVISDDHPSYNALLPREEGSKSMTFGFEVPYTIGARDTALPKAAKTGTILAQPKDVKSYMSNPNLRQFIDQQFVDEVSTYGDYLKRHGKERADEYATSLLRRFMSSQ